MERTLGVNLSGWFIPEPWVTPSLYAATGASNAAELQEAMGTAAYNERALCDGRLARGERRVEIDLSYSRLAEDYSLGGSGELVLVYPRALLADVRDLEHI